MCPLAECADFLCNKKHPQRISSLIQPIKCNPKLAKHERSIIKLINKFESKYRFEVSKMLAVRSRYMEMPPNGMLFNFLHLYCLL